MTDATTSTAVRAVIPVFAITLLLSAFLLFLVQPMFGKMILPLLGGSPSVWNTAMLFFQALLLAGYAYAHGTARFLNIKMQAALHIVLLGIFVVVLPIAIPDGWIPPAGKDPTLWQLSLMAVAVGGPFFVLSGSAPMLQHWFAHTKHPDAENPYFLYGASNLGSMGALIAYPFFVEPAMKVSEQSMSWAYGYGALIVFVLLSALLALRHFEPAKKAAMDNVDAEVITNQRRLLWLALAFVPSSLMLGVTTYITTDLASLPLLWIIPLALYVSTFIIAFAKKPILDAEKTYYLQGLILMMILGLVGSLTEIAKPAMIVAHLLLFFLTALMCHQQLAAVRPSPRHLTQFYLIMSLGGALGGFFNAIIAPKIFIVALEYGLVLALGCFLRECIEPEKSLDLAWKKFKSLLQKREQGFLFKSGIAHVAIVAAAVFACTYFDQLGSLRMVMLGIILTVLTINLEKRWVFGFCALAILILHPPGSFWGGSIYDKLHHRDRNFFGIIRVADIQDQGVRLLLHGTTIHGTQPLAAEHKLQRLSYYSEKSGISDALAFDFPGEQKVGVLGLGAGVISCYQKQGRSFDFFEIDPAVVEVAENRQLFTYLSDCGSPYEIVLGDGRLTMANKPDGIYDVIVMDAFSSDSIPIHLLTIESFQMYKKKLKPGGAIVINISNRYLDLRPVVAAAAQALDMQAFVKVSPGGKIETMPYYQAEFMAVSDNQHFIDHLKTHEWEVAEPKADFRLWTDQYSNITSLFKLFLVSAAEPFKEKTIP